MRLSWLAGDVRLLLAWVAQADNRPKPADDLELNVSERKVKQAAVVKRHSP
jgi:hypothetical protein